MEGTDGPKPSAPVYKLSVARYHTHFVGDPVWGFAVWSHNEGINPCAAGSNAAEAGLAGGASPAAETVAPQAAGSAEQLGELANLRSELPGIKETDVNGLKLLGIDELSVYTQLNPKGLIIPASPFK